MKRFLIALSVAAAVTIGGCSSQKAQNARQQSREAAEATGDYLQEQQKELRAELEKSLDEAQHRLDEWKADAKVQSRKAQREARKQKQVLEGKVSGLRRELDSLEPATRDTWNETKTRLRKAAREIEAEVKNLTDSD